MQGLRTRFPFTLNAGPASNKQAPETGSCAAPQAATTWQLAGRRTRLAILATAHALLRPGQWPEPGRAQRLPKQAIMPFAPEMALATGYQPPLINQQLGKTTTTDYRDH